MTFQDSLYGTIKLPDWLIPFIKSPEFLRLRGIRLSNVDSFQFKDFNTPTRWEHCISVAYLAGIFAHHAQLDESEKVHLILAALFHDIATPPFAHTMEYVLNDFDHELESYKVLSYKDSHNINHAFPVFASQLPRFSKISETISKQIGVAISTEEVAQIAMGEGKWGFAIKGVLDLDNIDNVTRAAMYMGISVDRDTPIQLVKWLAIHKCAPKNIKQEENVFVKEWLGYRYNMYKYFYNSSDEELGRQAFLQHIIRQLIGYGISRTSLIFNTDDGLLNLMENIQIEADTPRKNKQNNSLRDLVIQYRLLADTHKILELNIEREDDLRIINTPLFSEWLELHLKASSFEPFVFVKKRRYEEKGLLFPLPAGSLLIFKLSSVSLKHSQLPTWMQKKIQKDFSGELLSKKIHECINSELKSWLVNKPWHQLSAKRIEDIKSNLNNINNWDFKLSRNELMHSYPATFVHAIPASLIAALGLKGEIILDPFGGSGITAMEAIKQGCKVYISDSNSIANLITRAKFTYLDDSQIKYIKNISRTSLSSASASNRPDHPDLHKWHHNDTLIELVRIRSFISDIKSEEIKLFLTTCFSDILNSTSERKGRDFAYFADNTPLPKGMLTPQYVDAITLFINKINRNIQIIERTYSLLEQQGKNVKQELSRVNIYQYDATSLTPEQLNIKSESVDAIITSPPYLCMVDYTYGQRLPYYWLYPGSFEVDHKHEIGARRGRNNPKKAKETYLTNMRLFARSSYNLLKQGGYLATVIGSPLAQTWANDDIVKEIYEIFEQEGFKLLWKSARQIQWHRNHGLAKLRDEMIAVHVKY